jgi:periplasmic divalent cation tolerance protein
LCRYASPQCAIRNPQSAIRNPQSAIRNPQSAIRNPQSAIRMSAILVLITAPTEVAPALARALVEARLAACVNLLPGLRSVYRWQGEVCEAGETLLIAKTASARFAALREAVLRLHPYELPEIVAVKLDDAHPPYLQWLLSQVSDSPSP